MAERQVNSDAHDDLPVPVVEYDAEADLLYVSNGEVAPLGADMTQWVTVFYEDLVRRSQPSGSISNRWRIRRTQTIRG